MSHAHEVERGSTPPVWLAHVVGVLLVAAFVLVAVHRISTGQMLNELPYQLFLEAALIASGWLLTWKQPRQPLGWLLVAVIGLYATQLPAALLADAIRPVAAHASAWLSWWGSSRDDTFAWVPSVALLFTQIPLRFPTGALPSRRWRWFSRFTIAATILSSVGLSTTPAEVTPGVPNPTYIPWTDGGVATLDIVVFGILLLPSFVGSLASLFVRYHGASALERAQLRWVFWGACIPIVTVIVFWLTPSSPFWTAVQQGVVVTYACIPISILFAVLRYRLYEIDRIISRTASYAVVTLAILGTYLLVVSSVTWLVPGLPTLGVALATLAAAAVFLPVLRWVRRRVDRRFDRAHYDAQTVVDRFGELLRNGADPHRAVGDLVVAIEQTLQPTSVGVWTPKEPTSRTERG